MLAQWLTEMLGFDDKMLWTSKLFDSEDEIHCITNTLFVVVRII